MGINEAKELNELLQAQKKLYEDQNKLLSSQMNMMQQLVNTLNQLDLERARGSVESLNSAVKNAADSVEQLGQGQQTMQSINSAAEEASDNMEDLASGAEKFGRKMLKLAPVVATIEGMGAGLRFSMNAMSGLINVSSSLIGSMFNLAASIIAVPFKMLNGLMEMAASGGGSELRQAIEDVRKEFGDLAQNEAGAVMQSWRQLDHFGGRLAETNLSIWRTMGNMAESLKRVHEMATALGPVFSAFTSEFRERKGVERLHAYQKGLGLTDEGFRAMGEQAARAGVSIQEMGREITSVAFAMGESFGINGKLIGREIGNMLDDFEHFGNVGVTELAQVAVYARKLGVEVEKLTGALDQFADFDKAAESVAQLSQAFGLQLDTLKLVQEQDPAANIERLRKAFFATGRSIETMTRQERALLATHTGLDQKTLSMVFSAQKQGMSYEDITKGGENAEKQQLSQAEAMQKLSNSIERLVKSGQALKGGFFDIFLQGFMRGIRWTKEFWGLMHNLRRSMRATRYAGMKVGQMFVKHFPGVRDILRGIGQLFDPRRFRKMLNGVVKAFREFFQNMTKNPQQALPVLLDKLKKTFFDWFNTSSPSGRRIINGFKSFFKAVAHMFTGLLKEAIKGMTKMFQFITNTLKDPSKAMQGLGQAQDGVIGFLMEIFEPLITFFRSPEGQRMLQELWTAFVDMLGEVWKKVQPMVARAIPGLAAMMFGPSFVTGMARGLTTALGAVFVQGIGGMVRNRMLARGTSQLTDAVNKLATKMPAGGGVGSVQAVGGAAKAAADTSRSTAGFGAREAAQLGLKLLAIATALAVGGVEMALAIVAIKAILETGGINSVEKIALPFLVIGAAMIGMIGLSIASKALNPSMSGQMAMNLALGAAALGAGGIAFALSLAAIRGVLEIAGLNNLESIGWPFLVLGAAVLATIALALTALTLEPTTITTGGALMLLASAMLVVSGAAFAGALWAINEILVKAGLDTPEKAAFPLMVMAGAASAMVIMAGAIMAAAAVANPAVIVAGLVGMIAIFGMLYLAVLGFKEVHEASKGIGMEEIKQTAKGLGAMAMVMTAGAAFAVGAAAVGALILSIGGGIAMVAGMAALGLITQKGAEHTRGIIDIINGIPTVNEQKLEVFVTVMKALGSFAANIASVINAATPSFLNLAAMPWGRDPQAEAASTLGMINDILDNMGTQVKQIIETITDSIQGLSPTQLDQSQKMASLISALVNLVEAMKPDTELTEGFFGDLLSVRVIEAAGQYFQRVSIMLPTLVRGTIGVMEEVNNLPPINEAKIKAFGTFIQGVGALMSAIAPSGGTLGILGVAEGVSALENNASSAMSTISQAFGGPRIERRTNRTQQMLNVIGQYAGTLMQVISQGSFLRNVQGFISGMADIASNLNENQIKGLETVSGIFETLVSVIRSIADSFSSEEFMSTLMSGPGVSPTAIRAMFNNLTSGIIEPIQQFLPVVIGTLMEATRGMSKSQIARVSSVVEVMSGLFNVIPNLIGAVNSLGEGGTDIASGRQLFDARLQGIRDLLDGLFRGERGTVIDSIRALGEARISPRAKRNAEVLAEVMTAAGRLGELVTSGVIRRLSGGGDQIKAVHAFFGHLFNPNWGGSRAGHWVNHIQEFGRVRLSTNVSRNIEQINSFVSGVSSIDFGMLARQATAAEQIDENVTERLQTGINALIDNTNNVGRRLRGASRRAFNIPAELQTFANNLGLRSTGRLEIAHQPIQFNVNWNITVDSAEFEKALVEREGSRILTKGDQVP